MEDNISRSSVPAQSMETPLVPQKIAAKPQGESLEQAVAAADRVGGANATPSAKVSEQRQAYGTAKTESLRDNGLWRLLIPAIVILFGLALIAIPLIILIPLLYTSLNPNNAVSGAHMAWVWIVMIVVEMALVAVIVWGIFRIFLTQAGNYRR
jgi:hypothetical protein